MKQLLLLVIFCSALVNVNKSTANTTQATDQPSLSLEEAVTRALENDAWQVGHEYRHHSEIALSVAAGQLPDPEITFSAANLPLDSLDFNLEQMTQSKIGVSQSFPRGKTRSLTREKFRERAEHHELMVQDRIAQVRRDVSRQWLDWFRAEKSIDIIEQNRSLFIELAEITRIGYASTTGAARQDDVIRAQIELLRLDDRVARLREQAENHSGALIEWFPLRDPITGQLREISDQLPKIALPNHATFVTQAHQNESELLSLLDDHPSIKSIDQQISIGRIEAQLARQKYKPAWKLSASYGYRDEDLLGRDRADFLTIGVVFDIPIFTSKRQDKVVQSADSTLASIETERQLRQRAQLAGIRTWTSRLMRLREREELYNQQLLIQTGAQTDASLTAYTHDDGDFSDVVSARIAQMNTQIEALNITVDKLRAIIELNYFLTQTDTTPVLTPAGEHKQ